MYNIYVKLPDYKRMYPINGDGGIAKNKIYASLYTKAHAEYAVKGLSKMNPELKFEAREA